MNLKFFMFVHRIVPPRAATYTVTDGRIPPYGELCPIISFISTLYRKLVRQFNSPTNQQIQVCDRSNRTYMLGN